MAKKNQKIQPQPAPKRAVVIKQGFIEKNAMKIAIAKGLQLAIFNSCDGLGIANQLAKLYLPQSIVMREVVADEAAQKFSQYFELKGPSLFVLQGRENPLSSYSKK